MKARRMDAGGSLTSTAPAVRRRSWGQFPPRIPEDRPNSADTFARSRNTGFRPAQRQAVSIEWLLDFVYRRQRVIELSGKSLHAGEAAAAGEKWIVENRASGDGCLTIERNMILGHKIEPGVIRGLTPDIHPDAETIHDIVLSMPWIQAALLTAFGRFGEKPQPAPEPKFYRVKAAGSVRKIKVNKTWDVELGCNVKWCPAHVYPDEQVIQMYTDRVQLFRDALTALTDRLRDVRLRDFVIAEEGEDLAIAAE